MQSPIKKEKTRLDSIQQQTLAFIFDATLHDVALIRKTHSPKGLEDMIGQWNGLGGKLKPHKDKNHKACILREIEEEASLIVKPTEIFQFGYIHRKQKYCSVWAGITTNPDNLRQEEGNNEPVQWHPIQNLPLDTYLDVRRMLPDAVGCYQAASSGQTIAIKDYTL